MFFETLMDHQVIGILAALGSAASWAIGAILFKPLSHSLHPVAMTIAKGLISSALLGLALVSIGYDAIDLTTLSLLIASGVLGIALGDTFFFAALQNLSAYVVVIFFMLGQVLTAVLAVLILGEHINEMEAIGILITIAGITLVLWGQSSNEEYHASRLIGMVYGMLSMLCMAGSTLIAKQALYTTPTIQATFIRMLAGLLGVLLFRAMSQQKIDVIEQFKNVKFSTQFLCAVLVVTFGGFWLSMVGIKYLDVAIANTINSTEPLFALPLAVIFLKERVTVVMVTGSLIAIAGIILLTGGWWPA